LRQQLSAAKLALLKQRLSSRVASGGDDGELAPSMSAAQRARERGCEPIQTGYDEALAAAAGVAQAAPESAALRLEQEELEVADARALVLMGGVLELAGIASGEVCAAESLRKRIGAVPAYGKLMERWALLLDAAGWVRCDGGDTRTSKRWSAGARSPSAASRALEYWPRNSREVAQVLRGERHALEVMDSGAGVFENVRHFHRDSVRSKYLNGIVAAGVGAFARSLPGRALAVLEVGAGVGGTTGDVLGALPFERSTYEFTDLSNAFFEFAREQFSGFPWVAYRTFDLNIDPAVQGFAKGGVDVVVGSNAVHCARVLRDTLQYLSDLLAPGGMLVLRELTAARTAHAILPGLIPGFSDYRDARSEVGSPLCDASDWRQRLEACGFERVACLPDGEPALDEHVVFARRRE
jgi:SAM-dependent methyltransferase